MVRKSYTPEQIINKLREAEIHINQGISIAEASRKIGITQQTYYRWRKEYGGLRIEQAKRLKGLEKENARLKKLVTDLSLDNAILVKRRITSQDVIDQLFELIIFKGIPEHIGSDNGPEFTANAVIGWLNRLGIKTLFIEPGSPWENGYIESFNGKLRDALLNREIFTTLTEAKVLIEQWRREYNQVRPHSSLGYRPPAPEVIIPVTLTK